MNWPQEIAKLAFVKQALAEVDKNGVWPHHLPAVAAPQARLAEVEAYLGYRLDTKYVDFLRHADGWQGFYQSVDLFGSGDLMGGEKMHLACSLAEAIVDSVWVQAGISREDVLSIAATAVDRDIFLLGKPNTPVSGTVLWFAGEEIDRFENFDEFFLAMVDYNREEVNYFKSKLSKPGH